MTNKLPELTQYMCRLDKRPKRTRKCLCSVQGYELYAEKLALSASEMKRYLYVKPSSCAFFGSTLWPSNTCKRQSEKSSTGNICDDLQPLSRADEEVGGESWQLVTAIRDEGDCPTLKRLMPIRL